MKKLTPVLCLSLLALIPCTSRMAWATEDPFTEKQALGTEGIAGGVTVEVATEGENQGKVDGGPAGILHGSMADGGSARGFRPGWIGMLQAEASGYGHPEIASPNLEGVAEKFGGYDVEAKAEGGLFLGDVCGIGATAGLGFELTDSTFRPAVGSLGLDFNAGLICATRDMVLAAGLAADIGTSTAYGFRAKVFTKGASFSAEAMREKAGEEKSIDVAVKARADVADLDKAGKVQLFTAGQVQYSKSETAPEGGVVSSALVGIGF